MRASVLHLDGLRVPLETGGGSRRARLTIEADGSLRLRAAEDVATDELTQFLASKRDWVYRRLAEKEVLQHEPVTKELVDGEGFLYLGRSHRLKLSDSDGAVRLERGRLILPRSLALAGEAHLIAWYRRCGEAWLRPRVGPWAERLRIEPAPSRWPTSDTNGGVRQPDGAYASTGPRSNCHHQLLTTSWPTSWPISAKRTTGPHSGSSWLGLCLTMTSASVNWRGEALGSGSAGLHDRGPCQWKCLGSAKDVSHPVQDR
jgi:hypothetical protein